MSFLILVANSLGALGFILAYFLTSDFAYCVIAYAFFAVLPVSLASLFDNPRDIFSPLNIMTYLMILSSPVFAIYIHYLADAERREMKMYGLEFAELVPGITLLVIGMSALLAGYAFAALVIRRHQAGRTVPRHSRSRLRGIALVVIAASLVAGLFFARDVGFTSAVADGASISQKRVHEDTVGTAPRGSALTHWRLLGTSLPHALIIVYAALAWSGRIRAGRLDYFLIISMLVTSAFIPFIASARTPIFEILLLLIMIRHYLVKRISFFRMSIIALAGLFAVGILGELRQADNTERPEGLARYFSVFEEVLAASYFMDLSKGAIIVKRVPEEVDYVGGWSLATVVIATVPRQIWPEKPIVRIGYFVGQEVIELRNETGIPPGFIAELYLNAGYFLIPLPMMLLGFLMRLVYSGIRYDNSSPGWALAYVLGISIVSLALLPADLTYALFLVLTNVLMAGVFYAVSRRGTLKAGAMLPAMPAQRP